MEGRLAFHAVDEGHAAPVELGLDLGVVPGGVPEVEHPEELGIDRVEQEAQEAVVAGLADLDPDRPEPVAEPADRLARRVDALDAPERGDAARERDGEAEAGRSLLRPALELLFRRESVEGRVQLDGREPRGVEAQELLGLCVSRIEAVLPGGVGEAGRTGIEAALGYDPSMTS